MNEPGQRLTWRPNVDDDLPARLSAYEDPADVDGRPAAGSAKGLVSLGFLGAALRRSARLWCALAAIGLIIGLGYFVVIPPAQKASVSVLLVDNPNQSPEIEIQTDMALAASYPVAAAVVHELGLRQTPSSFAGTYSVAQKTYQVLTITVGASTSSEAVQRASAVATQFLDYRAQYEQTQQQETETELNQQVSQAQHQLDSITKRISQVSAQPSSPARLAELSSLKAQRATASNAVSSLRSDVISTLVATRTVTQEMVRGSEVLNAATPVKRSFIKSAAIYAAGGLAGGLALGIVIVVIGAIVSDRLRRRDDIALAIGAPVRLSVGALARKYRVLDQRGGTAIRRRDMDRVVEHLQHAVPESSRGPAGLAVVAVDNEPVVAQAVIALAVSNAKQRRRVVLADLSAGAHAARLLGARIPGTGTVTTDGVQIVVVVPAADDVAPVGPLRSGAALNGHAQGDEALAAACARADLVISLVTLDPASGGEYLATWAANVVAMVTAGRSGAVRINAVGEMIRLCGASLRSVVVIDADKYDESLGASGAGYEPASL